MTSQDNLPPPEDKSGQVGNQRNYGIDLLRMVSMYMVCMLHTLGCGGILAGTAADPVKHCIAWFFEIAAYCAVNCFALISGYVGVKSKFKYRNLFRLWLQALFYTVGISLIFYFARPGSVGIKGLIKACFPICTGAYWYLAAYALMFFTIPQLNFILEKQKKNAVRILLWTFFILFCVCSLPPIIRGITHPVNGGYSAIWLAYLYMIGGFIRLYGCGELFCFSTECTWGKKVTVLVQSAFSSQLRRLAIYVLCIMVTFFSRTGGHYFVKKILGVDLFFSQLVNYNSPLILLAGIALLDLFSHMRLLRWIAIIRFASPLAFSVYLIQNQAQVWNLLFAGAFVRCSDLSPVVLPVAIIGIPMAIYVVCSMIDYLRLRLFCLLHIA